MIKLQFKADHPLWGLDYVERAGKKVWSHKPLDDLRIENMLIQFALQLKCRADVLIRAHAMRLLTQEEAGEGYGASVTFSSKYTPLMLEEVLRNGNVEPPEWRDLTVQEVSGALAVASVLAQRGR